MAASSGIDTDGTFFSVSLLLLCCCCLVLRAVIFDVSCCVPSVMYMGHPQVAGSYGIVDNLPNKKYSLQFAIKPVNELTNVLKFIFTLL